MKHLQIFGYELNAFFMDRIQANEMDEFINSEVYIFYENGDVISKSLKIVIKNLFNHKDFVEVAKLMSLVI